MTSTLPWPPVGRLSVRRGAGIAGYPDLVRFGLLGTLAVWTEGGRLVAVPEAKVRALLADLLIHLGRPVPADRLIDDLWGDNLPVHPAGRTHSAASQIGPPSCSERRTRRGARLAPALSPATVPTPAPMSRASPP